MRQDPLLASIGGTLRKFKRAEAWLRQAGLPTFLARVPIWLLCVQYCLMMKGKTGRIARIGDKIDRWLDTITALSRHEKARLELIDIDRGMRNDIESTKKTLLLLRELCVDVGTLFGSIGFRSRILDRTQHDFLTVVDESCDTATTLQRALELHDARALALLRQLHDQERKARSEVATVAEAVNTATTDGRESGRCDSIENDSGVERGVERGVASGVERGMESGPHAHSATGRATAATAGASVAAAAGASVATTACVSVATTACVSVATTGSPAIGAAAIGAAPIGAATTASTAAPPPSVVVKV
jgi:hypothetical protein